MTNGTIAAALLLLARTASALHAQLYQMGAGA